MDWVTKIPLSNTLTIVASKLSRGVEYRMPSLSRIRSITKRGFLRGWKGEMARLSVWGHSRSSRTLITFIEVSVMIWLNSSREHSTRYLRKESWVSFLLFQF